MLLVLVFDIAGDRCGRNAEKRFHHFAPYKVGMPVFAGKLRHDCPNVLIGGFESGVQNADGRGTEGRAVDQRDHGGVAAVLEHFVQPELQRTELAATGVWVCLLYTSRCV